MPRNEIIPMNQIFVDDSFNSRGKIRPIDVVDLAQDIKRNGLLQPVVVAPCRAGRIQFKYDLIAGFRRFMAHIVLKRTEISCYILDRTMPEVDARFLNLNENLQRQQLSFAQEAEALRKLYELNVSEQRVVKRLGQSRGWVQVRYLYLKLPKEIQEDVQAGFINQTDIRHLYSIYHTEGKEVVLRRTKELKEAKERGEKNHFKIKNKKPKASSKKCRNRQEIFALMEHIQDSAIGNGLWTRCLAWAAGEITTLEMQLTLKYYAKEEEIENYIPWEIEA